MTNKIFKVVDSFVIDISIDTRVWSKVHTKLAEPVPWLTMTNIENLI